MKTLTIDISPVGEVTIEADGFKGRQCTDATQQILLTLGGEAKTEPKPEFSLPADIQNTVGLRI